MAQMFHLLIPMPTALAVLVLSATLTTTTAANFPFGGFFSGGSAPPPPESTPSNPEIPATPPPPPTPANRVSQIEIETAAKLLADGDHAMIARFKELSVSLNLNKTEIRKINKLEKSMNDVEDAQKALQAADEKQPIGSGPIANFVTTVNDASKRLLQDAENEVTMAGLMQQAAKQKLAEAQQAVADADKKFADASARVAQLQKTIAEIEKGANQLAKGQTSGKDKSADKAKETARKKLNAARIELAHQTSWKKGSKLMTLIPANDEKLAQIMPARDNATQVAWPVAMKMMEPCVVSEYYGSLTQWQFFCGDTPKFEECVVYGPYSEGSLLAKLRVFELFALRINDEIGICEKWKDTKAKGGAPAVKSEKGNLTVASQIESRILSSWNTKAKDYLGSIYTCCNRAVTTIP